MLLSRAIISIIIIVSSLGDDTEHILSAKFERNCESGNRRLNSIDKSVCFLRCLPKASIKNDNIVINLVNLYSKERVFVFNASVKSEVLNCVSSKPSHKSCGNTLSDCVPQIKLPGHLNKNSTECVVDFGLNEAYYSKNLYWDNFEKLLEGTACLMKCILQQNPIYDEKGMVSPLYLRNNIEHLDIIPEKRNDFKKCILDGKEVHTCPQVIYVYVCFFKYFKKGSVKLYL